MMSDITASVILTTNSIERVPVLLDAIRSVRDGDCHHLEEILVVIDEDKRVRDAVQTACADDDAVRVLFCDRDDGLAAARNVGAIAARGDVYAFLDDDCIVSSGWLSALCAPYENGALGTGGPAYARWEGEGRRPGWLPEEFDWLIGCGPYDDLDGAVRNTYGCNISFDGHAFTKLGGFDEAYGLGSGLQAEETELASRLEDEFGRGHFVYDPRASVEHRVFPGQVRVGRLLKRAWTQGKSKRRMGIEKEERAFLADTLKQLPKAGVRGAAASIGFTAATGLGYVAGR